MQDLKSLQGQVVGCYYFFRWLLVGHFKSWKMMLWKCYTQYASKFGKLSNGHRTGKDQFSFQSQRKAMPKNAQTIAQLHSSHSLVKQCSKFYKPGFSSTWIVNFQMFKLVLEKAEEPEFKLPTSAGSWKKKEFQENIYSCFIDYTKAFDCVDHKKLWKILKKMGIPEQLYLPPEKHVWRSRSIS